MSRSFLLPILLFALTVTSLGAPAGFVFGQPAQTSPSRWTRKVIPISISTSLRRSGAFTDAGADPEASVMAAFATWEKVAGVSFAISWSDVESASPNQSRGDRKNLVTIAATPENLLMFSGDSSGDAARTRVFTDRRGSIIESDIVLNPYQQFSTDGAFGTFDLQAVLTHEIGHLLGLPHSPVLGATMTEYLAKNGTFGSAAFAARELSSDDLVGIRGLYGSDSEECCGSVAGKIDQASAAGRIATWLEDAETGRVVAGRYADANGFFLIDGLEEGEYVLRVETSGTVSRRTQIIQAEEDVIVSKDEKVWVRPSAKLLKRSFGPMVNGSGSQFAPVAVEVSKGAGGSVLLGATGKLTGAPKISSTSSLISVLEVQIYGGEPVSGLSPIGAVLGFGEALPSGDYTLVVSDESGIRSFLIGGLKIVRGTTAKNPF